MAPRGGGQPDLGLLLSCLHSLRCVPRFSEGPEHGDQLIPAHKKARKGRKGATSFASPTECHGPHTRSLIESSRNSASATLLPHIQGRKLSLREMMQPVRGRPCICRGVSLQGQVCVTPLSLFVLLPPQWGYNATDRQAARGEVEIRNPG